MLDSLTMPASRPPLAFSLRTLLMLVAISGMLCGWLARERRTVKARQALLAQIQIDRRATIRSAEQMSTQIAGKQVSLSMATVPLVRRWLGDRPLHSINCGEDANPDTVAQVRRLFPEAMVCAQHSRY